MTRYLEDPSTFDPFVDGGRIGGRGAEQRAGPRRQGRGGAGQEGRLPGVVIVMEHQVAGVRGTDARVVGGGPPERLGMVDPGDPAAKDGKAGGDGPVHRSGVAAVIHDHPLEILAGLPGDARGGPGEEQGPAEGAGDDGGGGHGLASEVGC